MKTLEILPIKLYGRTCEVIDEIIEAVKDEPYKGEVGLDHNEFLNSQTENTMLHKSYPVLGNYLQRCNDETWDCIKHAGDFSRLVTTQAWMNKAVKGKHHRHHSHPNSVVSGILYLTTSETPTVFTNENLYKAGFIIVYPADEHHDTINIKAVKGRTILFPSKMTHVVPEHRGDDTRLTISWNTFLEGDVSRDDKLMGFSIKVN